MKFLKTAFVQDRRQALLKAKQDFLLRQSHLKSLGQRQCLMKRVNEWLRVDGDKLFDGAHGGTKKDVKFNRRMLSAGAKTNRSQQSSVDPMTTT